MTDYDVDLSSQLFRDLPTTATSQATAAEGQGVLELLYNRSPSRSATQRRVGPKKGRPRSRCSEKPCGLDRIPIDLPEKQI